jgi:2,3-bisphosphoglycerate-independent phosphoglycerate mutase
MKKAMLIILDGWGIGPMPERSAIAQASTPNFDALWDANGHSTLTTFGGEVGLPKGQMGNSEVGHLNIGAGRVVYQELARINNAIENGTLASAEALQDVVKRLNEGDGRLHLLGLYSDGGVHSHTSHFKALIDIFEEQTTSEIYLHTFLDGRDTDPKSGKGYLKDLHRFLRKRRTHHASVIGRYYAMDRDQRWERIALAYNLLVNGEGQQVEDLVDGVKAAYDKDMTDEFMEALIAYDHVKDGVIKPGDEVVFVNFRTDRPRQLTRVLAIDQEEDMIPLDIHMTTMTSYDEEFKDVAVIFDRNNVSNPMGEYLSSLGLTQLRAAETEKYAHVTYFFNGGAEEPFKGEERILVASPKVATYDLQPEMSAYPLTDKVIEHIEAKTPDFVCINYANTDMVGHTGVFEAAVKAAAAVDDNLGRLVEAAKGLGYRIVIIADHGNSDYMINDDGSPHTAHTMNPVPCIIMDGDQRDRVGNGKLADIAPTILHLMGIPVPDEMTGDILIQPRG